jgi:hypothetical protein
VPFSVEEPDFLPEVGRFLVSVLLLLQSCVLQYAVPRSNWQVLFRVRYRYKTWLFGVFEVVVAAFDAYFCPAILFQHSDQSTRVHLPPEC